MTRRKHVLVTGGDGFVAAHAIKKILQDTDWNITAVLFKDQDAVGERLFFASGGDLHNLSRIRTTICDLSNPIETDFSDNFGAVDYVVNLASESHVDRSISDPANFIINNVSVICNVLDWARVHKPEKILHVSTDEVFGPYTDTKFTEWDTHLPSNPYSASKAAQEDIIFAYWRTYSVPVSIINIMNVVGECQNVEKFTPMIVSKILNSETVDVHTYGDGEIGKRYWLHAANLASAMLHVLLMPAKLPSDSDKPNKFNVAGDEEFSNLEWVKKIADILKKPLEYRLVDSELSRPGYDPRYGLDNSKLLLSGWTPSNNLDRDLHDIVNWYAEYYKKQQS